jgi:hypothetical protein
MTCDHKWHTTKNGSQICTSCSLTFPCKTECGHFDCVEHKNTKFRCIRCKKLIENFDDVFFESGSKSYWLPHHQECSTVYQDQCLNSNLET